MKLWIKKEKNGTRAIQWKMLGSILVNFSEFLLSGQHAFTQKIKRTCTLPLTARDIRAHRAKYKIYKEDFISKPLLTF